MNLLTLGHGYSARVFADRARQNGWRVTGTTRSLDGQNTQAGIQLIEWKTGTALDVSPYTHILVSISPNNQGDPVLNQLKEYFAAAPSIKWIGYLSTTGVYGDHNGGWVSEETPATPTTQRGKWRVQAEQDWLDLEVNHNLPVHIFRLAGIYGPGRGPFEKILNGTARCIIKQNQVFSRIHVEDIATTLEASIERPNPGSIYNVCDNDPAPPQDVLRYAAQLLNKPAPPTVALENANLSPMAHSFYNDSKKVSNTKIKEELGVDLAYPTYTAGLNAIMST